MRLQELYMRCRHALSQWSKIQYTERKASSGTYYKIDNPEVLKETLAPLFTIVPLKESIEIMYNVSPDLQRGEWTGEIGTSDKSKIDMAYKKLYDKLDTICNMCEFLNVTNEREGFDIKLPPNISLSELSKCANDLDRILNGNVILRQINGQVSLCSVDIGSIWLTFVVGGATVTALLSGIAALVDKAVIIRSHMITAKEQEENARKLGLANDLLKSMVDAHKNMISLAAEKAVEELSHEYNIEESEAKGRLKYDLTTLAEWMGRGMEIYASIDTADETKAIFPPLEVQEIPTNKIELISEHTSESKNVEKNS